MISIRPSEDKIEYSYPQGAENLPGTRAGLSRRRHLKVDNGRRLDRTDFFSCKLFVTLPEDHRFNASQFSIIPHPQSKE